MHKYLSLLEDSVSSSDTISDVIPKVPTVSTTVQKARFHHCKTSFQTDLQSDVLDKSATIWHSKVSKVGGLHSDNESYSSGIVLRNGGELHKTDDLFNELHDGVRNSRKRRHATSFRQFHQKPDPTKDEGYLVEFKCKKSWNGSMPGQTWDDPMSDPKPPPLRITEMIFSAFAGVGIGFGTCFGLRTFIRHRRQRLYQEEMEKQKNAEEEMLLLGKAKLGKLPNDQKYEVLKRNGLISADKAAKMAAKDAKIAEKKDAKDAKGKGKGDKDKGDRGKGKDDKKKGKYKKGK